MVYRFGQTAAARSITQAGCNISPTRSHQVEPVVDWTIKQRSNDGQIRTRGEDEDPLVAEGQQGPAHSQVGEGVESSHQ